MTANRRNRRFVAFSAAKSGAKLVAQAGILMLLHGAMVEMRLIIDGDATSIASFDLPLLNATARAHRWYKRSAGGPGAVERRDRQARTSNCLCVANH